MGKVPTALVMLKCNLKFSCRKSIKGKKTAGKCLRPGESNMPDEMCQGCDYLIQGGVVVFNPDLSRVVSAFAN